MGGHSGDGIVEGGTAGNCNWVNKLKFDSLECIDWNGRQGRRRPGCRRLRRSNTMPIIIEEITVSAEVRDRGRMVRRGKC